mmetsp:Transcript_37340/g.42677  ORF Transcript_37340/g.42677 Transcript_37340/m.42677 type:complete len:259 (+) Transcript_37340:82-858(+)
MTAIFEMRHKGFPPLPKIITCHHEKEVYPSILRLLGTKDWSTLKRLITIGAYQDIIQDKSKMLSIITFAVSMQVPLDTLHLLCYLNPGALTTGDDLPFRLARQQQQKHMKDAKNTLIILEAARQEASNAVLPSSPEEVVVNNPSMLRLLGKRDWETLKVLIMAGAYKEIIQNKSKMSSIITFAVSFQAPVDVLHMLCHLNPDSLTIDDLPFRLAKQNYHRDKAQTLITLEGARQEALVKSFNQNEYDDVYINDSKIDG